MRQNVIRIDLAEAFSYINGFIVSSQGLHRSSEPMHSFGESRIGAQRILQLGHCVLGLAVRHQIEGSVIVIFSFLASSSIGHVNPC